MVQASRPMLWRTPWRMTIDAGHLSHRTVQASISFTGARGNTRPGLWAIARVIASDHDEFSLHRKLRDAEQLVERTFAGFANNAGRDWNDAGGGDRWHRSFRRIHHGPRLRGCSHKFKPRAGDSVTCRFSYRCGHWRIQWRSHLRTSRPTNHCYSRCPDYWARYRTSDERGRTIDLVQQSGIRTTWKWPYRTGTGSSGRDARFGLGCWRSDASDSAGQAYSGGWWERGSRETRRGERGS